MSRILERAEREQRKIEEKKAEHAAEIARIVAEHDAIMKREAAERKRLEDEAQAKCEAAFEAELEANARALFFNGSPGAPESLYAAKREEYRGLVLRRRAEAASDAPQHSLYRYIR